MLSVENLLEAYPARLRLLKTLLKSIEGEEDAQSVREASSALLSIGSDLGNVAAGNTYVSTAQIAYIIADIIDWKSAVRAAEQDADRFLRAAKLKASEFVFADNIPTYSRAALQVLLENLQNLQDLKSINQLIGDFIHCSLPLPLDRAPKERERTSFRQTEEPTPRPTVFLEFWLEGETLRATHYMHPNRIYDLNVRATVRNWPDNAESLVLTVVSVEPRDAYEFPEFEFTKPNDKEPYVLSSNNRALLKYDLSERANPIEIRYSAYFKGVQITPYVSGHTRLVLDAATEPITNNSEADSVLRQIRNDLRSYTFIPPQDKTAFFILLKGCVWVAINALNQQGLFDCSQSEEGFQHVMEQQLRAYPSIGSELEVHPQTGQGISDLSFRQIRLELKYENQRMVTMETAERYIEQTAQYAVASGKSLSVLAVLDCTPLRSAPPSLSGDIRLTERRTAEHSGHPNFVGVVIIRGNLARPSDHSRRSGNVPALDSV